MPIYEAECGTCGGRVEFYAKVEERESALSGRDCGCGGKYRLAVSLVAKPLNTFSPHFNYSLGRHVSSKADMQAAADKRNRDYERQGLPNRIVMKR